MRNQIAPCGTIAGYQRHMKYRQEVCPPCREAISEYNIEWQVKHDSPLAIARREFLRAKALG